MKRNLIIVEGRVLLIGKQRRRRTADYYLVPVKWMTIFLLFPPFSIQFPPPLCVVAVVWIQQQQQQLHNFLSFFYPGANAATEEVEVDSPTTPYVT